MATSRLLTSDLVAPGILHPRGSCRKDSLSFSRLDTQKGLHSSSLCLLQHRSAESLRFGVTRVQCRGPNNYGSRTATVRAAVTTSRRLTARERAEQDRQFATELQQVLNAKGLPELIVPSPQELSDMPELVKEIRRRGQFEVARLLGKYAASQEDFSPPPSAAGKGKHAASQEDSSPPPSAAEEEPLQTEYSHSLRPLGPPPIPESNNAKIPSSIVEKLEADGAQQGERSRGAPTGGRGKQLSTKDAHANNDVGDRLKQLVGSLEPAASSGPSIGERAAHFLQTGKMDGDMQFDGNTSSDSDDGDGAMSDGSIAEQKANMLKAKLRQRGAGLPTAPVLDTLQSENEKLFQEIQREQQQLQQMDLSERQSEDDFKAQTFQELRRIKDVLASRETEVTSMAEALKEARAQLNLLRAKSAAELSQARQEVLELQTRMRIAEKALEGLKQVRVEYWGEGDSVELAGSFNGWGYFLTMEPDLSTEIPPPEGGRGPMVFGCDMRLYPGEYEIKFIVDGEWQVDSRREIVSRGLVQNNVLRVE